MFNYSLSCMLIAAFNRWRYVGEDGNFLIFFYVGIKGTILCSLNWSFLKLSLIISEEEFSGDFVEVLRKQWSVFPPPVKQSDHNLIEDEKN